MNEKILPMMINVIPASEFASDEFLDRLAEKVAQKMKAQAQAQSTEELTDGEAAKILRRSVSTVRRMKKNGTIPTVQKGGVRVIRMCDVLEVKR
jgi:hypothetical protein